MKRGAFPLFVLAFITSEASARIGDAPVDFKKRYGDPIAESFDTEGRGIRIYRSADFKEIRVTFAANKSQVERYTVADASGDKEALFDKVRAENGDEYSYVTTQDQLEIGQRDSALELKFVRGDGAQRTYSGRLEIKKKAEQDWAVLHDGASTVEILLASLGPEAARLKPARSCTVTVLNRIPDDLWTPMAWVGRREHIDHDDMMEDAHAHLQTLVSMEIDGKGIYDRSFCSVHQVVMELRTVEVAFGMLAFPADERYCQEQFPHYRDFAVGGCVMTPEEENKAIPMYICPACVTACNEYKATRATAQGPD